MLLMYSLVVLLVSLTVSISSAAPRKKAPPSEKEYMDLAEIEVGMGNWRNVAQVMEEASRQYPENLEIAMLQAKGYRRMPAGNRHICEAHQRLISLFRKKIL